MRPKQNRVLTDLNKLAAMWLAYSTDSDFQKKYAESKTPNERDILLQQWCLKHDIHVDTK